MKDINKEIEKIIVEVCRWVDGNDGHIDDIAMDKGVEQIKTLLQEERRKTLKEVREKVINHINNNWHASLGYGDDKEVYEKALDELGWITEPLGITLDKLLKV